MSKNFDLEAGHVIQNLEGLGKYLEKRGRDIENIRRAVVNPENPYGYLGKTKIYMLEIETEKNGEKVGFISTHELDKIEKN